METLFDIIILVIALIGMVYVLWEATYRKGP